MSQRSLEGAENGKNHRNEVKEEPIAHYTTGAVLSSFTDGNMEF